MDRDVAARTATRVRQAGASKRRSTQRPDPAGQARRHFHRTARRDTTVFAAWPQENRALTTEWQPGPREAIDNPARGLYLSLVTRREVRGGAVPTPRSRLHVQRRLRRGLPQRWRDGHLAAQHAVSIDEHNPIRPSHHIIPQRLKNRQTNDQPTCRGHFSSSASGTRLAAMYSQKTLTSG